MPRGGVRIGAGRKAGSTDRAMRKITVDRVLNATGTGPDATPLAYMLAVMQDKNNKETIRLQAAIAAAPYVHPKLAAIEVKSENKNTLTVQHELASALKDLAELARMRTIDGEAVVLEPAALEQADIMSGHADILSGGHFVQQADILSGVEDEADIMSGQDGVLDGRK